MPIIFSQSSLPPTTIPNTLPNFSHPLEQERLTALQGNRIFNLALRLFGEVYARLTDLAQIPDRYFPVTSKTFPELDKLYEVACKKLEMQTKPNLFCTMDYTRNAKTLGTDGNCVIVIDSSCLEDFSPEQITALLGRELGHVKMKHIKYLTAFDMIDDLLQSIPLNSRLLSVTLVNTVKGLFLEWLLAAEYTADRAAAIAAGSILPVMQNHLMTSGIENVEDCKNYKLYMQSSFTQNISNFNRAAQVVLMGTLRMFPIPFVIPRMQELEKWSQSNECRQNFPQVYTNDFVDTKLKNNSNVAYKNTKKSLVKGQKIELTKKNSEMKRILIGLGWDTNKYTSESDFDIDAAAFLLGIDDKVNDDRDFVFYGNLEHASESVKHLGDNLTGVGEGDAEQIEIDLSKVPVNIKKIAFTVTIYEADKRHQNFGQVENTFIRIVNMDTNEEIIRYDLGEDFSIETAIVVGEIYRYKGEWKFNAVGAGFKGGLKTLCKNYGVDVL